MLDSRTQKPMRYRYPTTTATLTLLTLIEIAAGTAHAQPGPDQCSTERDAKAAVLAVVHHLSHATTPEPDIDDSLSGLA